MLFSEAEEINTKAVAILKQVRELQDLCDYRVGDGAVLDALNIMLREGKTLVCEAVHLYDGAE